MHSNIMTNERVCDYCKQETNSLFGLFDMMLCSKCYAKVVSSFKFAMRT